MSIAPRGPLENARTAALPPLSVAAVRRNGIELHPVLGFACLSKAGPPPPPSGGKCAASYPTVCIRPPPPDLDCGEIPYRNFRVRWDVANPDPHRFDGNHNRVGCET